MDKVTRQCPKTATLSERKENRSGIEPRSFRLLAERLTATPPPPPPPPSAPLPSLTSEFPAVSASTSPSGDNSALSKTHEREG